MSGTSSQGGPRKPRTQTASQIAKDPTKFTIWSSYHNLVEGDFHVDMPDRIRQDTEHVFTVFGLLPESWVAPDSKLSEVLDPEFMKFLRSAHRTQPELFSKDRRHQKCTRILTDLQTVFLARKRLKKLRSSSCKSSEADYASQIYDVLRVRAGQVSDNRSQCSISLPQPLSEHRVHDRAAPILKARTVRPDGSLFIPTRRIQELWCTEDSPYNILNRNRGANNAASHGGRSSFKWQSTLCAKLPNSGLEIASTFWEDKKPAQQELAGAYRQNRMATTAALRQLHAMNVDAPGTVRAHVDWWKDEGGQFRILSAAYPGPLTKAARRTSLPFHEWDLEKPGDIIQVYLIIRNLDRWTASNFADRVKEGITAFAADVADGRRVFVPWRRREDVGSKVVSTDIIGESISYTSAKTKVKKRKQQRPSRSSP